LVPYKFEKLQHASLSHVFHFLMGGFVKAIAFLVGDLGIAGGGERVVCTLANFLVQYYDVHIFHFGTEHPFEIIGNVKVHDLNVITKNRYLRKIDRLFLLRKNLKESKISLIINFGWQPAIYTLIASVGLNLKILSSERNNPMLEPNQKILKIIRNVAYKKSNFLVCQTQAAKKYFNITQSKVVLNPLRDDIPMPMDFRYRENLIVNFCRLYTQKNLPLLIKAFKKFHVTHPFYLLKIYGDGELKLELLKLIDYLDLTHFVQILPFRANILDSIKVAKMFVSSSNYEGLSNSMLEALALGIPVVVTDCPIYGARMVVNDYKNGIIVPMNDLDRMCDAMSFLADNEEKSKQISDEAIKIRDFLSVEAVCKEWKRLIDIVLSKRETGKSGFSVEQKKWFNKRGKENDRNNV